MASGRAITIFPENLVFSAAGTNGPGHIGAIRAALETNLFCQVKRVGGASAGAIAALAVVLDLQRDELLDLLKKLNINQFLDWAPGLCGTVRSLFGQFGCFPGTFARRYFNELIENKTGIKKATFADLKRLGLKDLYVTTTNVSRQNTPEIFSYETTPQMEVAHAVYASMAIPFCHVPLKAKKNERGELVHNKKEGEMYADGGTVNMFPIKMFDGEQYGDSPTLGFYLVDPKEISWIQKDKRPPIVPITNIIDYGTKITKGLVLKQRIVALKLDEKDKCRTVLISTQGYNPVYFGITQKEKQALFDGGIDAVKVYLNDKLFEKALSKEAPSLRAKL